MAFTHKSMASDLAREVGRKMCTLQPLLECWWDDKGGDRQTDRQGHQRSPLALSRAALVLVKRRGFEEETQVCGNNNLQEFYSRICRALNTPSRSSGPVFTSIPECWSNSTEVPSNASKQDQPSPVNEDWTSWRRSKIFSMNYGTLAPASVYPSSWSGALPPSPQPRIINKVLTRLSLQYTH